MWISTPAGSSSAARAAGGKLLPLYSKKLQYVVREAYIAGDKPPYRFTHGIIEGRETLWIASRLPNARAYIDGTAHEQVVGFNDELSFSIDPRPLRLFGRSKVMDALHKR